MYGQYPIQFDQDEVSVPPGFSQVKLLASEGEAGSCGYGPNMNGSHLYRGFVINEISLPESVRNIEPTQLVLYLSADGGWTTLPQIELLDVERKEWVSWPEAKLGRNILENPLQFYRPEQASLQIRLSQENVNNVGGCVYLELALDGKRPL